MPDKQSSISIGVDISPQLNAAAMSSLDRQLAQAASRALTKGTGMGGYTNNQLLGIVRGYNQNMSQFSQAIPLANRTYDIRGSKTRQWLEQVTGSRAFAGSVATNALPGIQSLRKQGENMARQIVNKAFNSSLKGMLPEGASSAAAQQSSFRRLMLGKGHALSGLGGIYAAHTVGGALGGTPGAIGMMMAMGGGGVVGAGAGLGLMGLGMSVKATTGIADLFGLNKEGLTAYADFEKSLLLAANFLGETFTPQLKDKLQSNIMKLSETLGVAASATEIASVQKLIAGSGVITATTQEGKLSQMNDITRAAMELSAVSEGATVDTTTDAILKLTSALAAKGITKYGIKDIASMLYGATTTGLITMEQVSANAGDVATAIMSGQDPVQAIGTMALASNVGLTSGESGTVMRRMSDSLVDKNTLTRIASVLGGNPMDYAGMPISEVMKKTTSAVQTAGLGEAEVNVVMKQLFGDIRSGRVADIISNFISEDADAFDTFLKKIYDGANSLDTFSDALDEVKKSTANQLSNLDNTLANIKLKAAGYSAPLVMSAVESFMYSGNLARDEQGLLRPFNPVTHGFVNYDTDTIFEELKVRMAENGDEALIPLVEGVKKFVDVINDFTKEHPLEEMIGMLASAFDSAATVIVGFARGLGSILAPLMRAWAQNTGDTETLKFVTAFGVSKRANISMEKAQELVDADFTTAQEYDLYGTATGDVPTYAQMLQAEAGDTSVLSGTRGGNRILKAIEEENKMKELGEVTKTDTGYELQNLKDLVKSSGLSGYGGLDPDNPDESLRVIMEQATNYAKANKDSDLLKLIESANTGNATIQEVFAKLDEDMPNSAIVDAIVNLGDNFDLLESRIELLATKERGVTALEVNFNK